MINGRMKLKTFFACMTVIVLMFIHLIGLIENCSSQLDGEKYVITAFNG